eukprot:gene32130-41659_t
MDHQIGTEVTGLAEGEEDGQEDFGELVGVGVGIALLSELQWEPMSVKQLELQKVPKLVRWWGNQNKQRIPKLKFDRQGNSKLHLSNT